MTLCVAAFLTSCSSTTYVNINDNLEKPQITVGIQEIFLNRIPKEDFKLLESVNLILNVFQSLKDKKFDRAKKISENILYTKELPQAIYKFAFKAYSISTVLLINTDSNKKNILKNFDFSSFQNDQCKSLCDSFGWKELVNENSLLFTPLGYNEIILSKDTFSAINQEKPEWINKSFLVGNQTNITRKNNLKFVHLSSLGDHDNDNLQEYNSNEDVFTSIEDQEHQNENLALSFFIKGEFKKAIDLFSKIAFENNDPSVKSFAYYWIGRAYTAENRINEAKKYYLMSGSENPLGLYDSLSGQMIKNPSGRASTKELSPFPISWENQIDNWVSYPDIQYNSPIIISLKSALLLAAKIRVENKFLKIDDFQKFILSKKTIESLLLNDEINYLAKKWENVFQIWLKQNKPDVIGNNIAWLYYLTGNYIKSIALVSKIKDTLDPYSENNNFLYFLFYPRFHKEKIKSAIADCNVDPDIMYAIFKQEGFFHHQNEDENVLSKVCLFKKSLDKYKNNVVSALSAYSAGFIKTDTWLQKNLKINDDAIFMEYIPENKIKEFVQGTMKNYYNFKWIYFKKKN